MSVKACLPFNPWSIQLLVDTCHGLFLASFRGIFFISKIFKISLQKAATLVWAKQLTQLSCLVLYVQFQCFV